MKTFLKKYWIPIFCGIALTFCVSNMLQSISRAFERVENRKLIKLQCIESGKTERQCEIEKLRAKQ